MRCQGELLIEQIERWSRRDISRDRRAAIARCAVMTAREEIGCDCGRETYEVCVPVLMFGKD